MQQGNELCAGGVANVATWPMPKIKLRSRSGLALALALASLLDLQINLFNSHSTRMPQREIFYNADTQRGVKVHSDRGIGRSVGRRHQEQGTGNWKQSTGSMANGRLKRAWDLRDGRNST